MAHERFVWLVAIGLLLVALPNTLVRPGDAASARMLLGGAPKPNGLGALSGVYDVLIHDGTKTAASYHCILRLDHDSASNAAKAAAQCYADTPGLTPDSPLVDPADGSPGPPPPPPYTVHPPAKLAGQYLTGSDTLTLTGCLKDAGGVIGPHVLLALAVPDAVAGLPDLGGTADVFANQSLEACDSATPAGSASSEALSLTRVSSARDYDGDGCTDAQELDKALPAGTCGDDPYNPHDSDLDFNGPYTAVASQMRASWDEGADALVPGVYLACIGNLAHNLGSGEVTARSQCYLSSPVTAAGNGSAIPWRDQGLPHPPPPPPFQTSAPAEFSGQVVDGDLFLLGCFRESGGISGPNVIAEVYVGNTPAQRYVGLYFNQSNDDCDADPPTPQGLPDQWFALDLAEQDDSHDSDGDGCTDAQELAIAGPPPGCGDDPFNPLDSDGNAGGVAHVVLTVERADWNGALAPGSYYTCAASTQHNLSTNALTTRLSCYLDDAGLTVNCQFVAGSTGSPCSAAASACPPSGAVYCGDGQRGAPPPRIDPDPVPPDRSAFGDVDSPHATLTGSYEPMTGEVVLAGCLHGVEHAALGPSVYLNLAFDLTTGVGAGSVYPGEQPADCKAGAPAGLGQSVTVAWTEQGVNFDTDLDNCSDTRELADTASTGGLRDPFNYWDFRSVPTGAPPARDVAVAVTDIGAIVARYGSSDAGTTTSVTRYSHPVATPVTVGGGYHPAFDTAGGLAGSAGPWNLRGPDGAIAVNDVGAAVSQFGHNCG